MPRKISLAAIKAALQSPKTPVGLKKGLMKKYGHLLGGSKVPMEALATTMRPNPKKLSPHLALEKRDTIAKVMKKPVYEVPQVGDVIKVKGRKFLVRRHSLVVHLYHIEDTRGFIHIVREADLANARPQIIDHQRL